LLDELLGDNLTKAEDYKAYKEKNKSKFDELISLSGQIERLAAESMDKYEQVLKLKLPEKYKEYTSIKIQEFKKRADLHKLIAPFIKEFLQTNDIDKINKLIEDFNKQSADMLEEADKLSEKAGQFAKDNPNVFKN
jgi:predicted house-cleaning noncanonical NTP pyrophosphatase (MazG superfamily)